MNDRPRLVETEERAGALWVWLNRPERHNALVPDLLFDLQDAIAEATSCAPVPLVISGRGASFSTGGDIAAFLRHSGSKQELLDYSEFLVGALHSVILDLLSFPAPVLAAVNGPVTGGSTGLLLAADMNAMSETAFLQPYYSEVGFGPDGGWTALLPNLVGVSKALEIQYLNKRVFANEALALGLTSCVCPSSQLDQAIKGWVGAIGRGYLQTHQATRRHVWNVSRLDEVRDRLDQEKASFLDLIARPETIAGMEKFAGKRG
ncbi:enoyl-CoA hydratase/isomerase family protein [Roseibium album]|uniref:enoyl-CoA hydratase/isomerase family protein n=1 Tax=Roseibium album TaxID=311410 RepID=UPI00391B6FBE